MTAIIDGTNSSTFPADASISGLTVGKGGGAVSTNTAVGASALTTNSSGANNTAVGYQAGYSGVTAPRNTSIGYKAGYANTTGYNCFIGTTSGTASTGYGNTFVGSDYANGCGALVTSGNNNTILGGYSGNQGGLDIRTASNYIVLSDGDGNPRLIVDNNGKILLGGVTSAYSGNGISISSSQNTVWTNCTASGQNALVVQNSTNGTGTSCNLVAFNVGTAGGGTSIGTITYNGTTTLYNATSDQRLKENIVDSETALTTLNQIKIRAFDWIDSKIHETHGVIAQELHEIAPQCVTEGINHEDGSIDRPWQVDTSPLVPMLIKAIQELKTIVDAQAAEIAELKAKA
jgi:hypothetical protein